MSVNKVILIGRVGQQPEIKQISNTSRVANFSLAVDEKWKDKSGQTQKITHWLKIVAWGKLADICAQFLQKGREVFVEGKLQVREWEDKEGNKRSTTEILAQSVQFLGDKRDGEPTSGSADEDYPLPF
jgi:single-strand DNA-binding protein